MVQPDIGEGQVVVQKVLAQMAVNQEEQDDLFGDPWMKFLHHC